MRVRLHLPLRIDARTLVLDEIGCLTESTIGFYRKSDNAAATVIRYKQELPGCIDAQVTRRTAPGRALIEETNLPGVLMDVKRRDGTARLAFVFVELVDGVEILAAWVNLHERGMFNAARLAGILQRAGRAIKAIDIDALAVAVRISADINEIVLTRLLRHRSSPFSVFRNAFNLRLYLRIP